MLAALVVCTAATCTVLGGRTLLESQAHLLAWLLHWHAG